MITQNAYAYIQIGLCLRFLRHISAQAGAKAAKDTIDQLKKGLQKAEFEVSLSAMKLTSFVEMSKALADAPEDKPIGAAIHTLTTAAFKTLEEVVFAEAQIKKIYVLTGRRFNSQYLLSEPHRLLKEGTFEKLEPIARSDFTSACRCIAFGEATAAAFHILRATESVLRSFYQHHRRQKRLSKPMWGPMVDQLKAKTRNKPSESLLASLDLIRTAYRNPTQHPEALYEIDSAQDLMGVCIDAIGKMCEELEPHVA